MIDFDPFDRSRQLFMVSETVAATTCAKTTKPVLKQGKLLPVIGRFRLIQIKLSKDNASLVGAPCQFTKAGFDSIVGRGCYGFAETGRLLR